MKLTTLFTILFLSAAACDGNQSSPSGADAGPDDPDDPAAIAATAFMVGTDYAASGTLSRLDFPSGALTNNVIASVASDDAVIRRANDKLYIVNRYGSDNVTIIDTETSQLIAQISTGNGTNPQDVAIFGRKIFVCAQNSGSVIIINEDAPTAEPGAIDISGYDDDGNPDCNSIIYDRGRVFLTLDLLDETWISAGGKVLVIDPHNDVVIDELDLSTSNPFGFIKKTPQDSEFGGDLLVPTVDWATGAGCIERISTGIPAAAEGCLVTNADLGGYATVVEPAGDQVWASVSTSFTTGRLVSVSAGLEVSQTSVTPESQYATDFARCPSGHLVTNDANTGSVVVYDADGVPVSGAPFSIGLLPVYTNGMLCH